MSTTEYQALNQNVDDVQFGNMFKKFLISHMVVINLWIMFYPAVK